MNADFFSYREYQKRSKNIRSKYLRYSVDTWQLFVLFIDWNIACYERSIALSGPHTDISPFDIGICLISSVFFSFLLLRKAMTLVTALSLVCIQTRFVTRMSIFIRCNQPAKLDKWRSPFCISIRFRNIVICSWQVSVSKNWWRLGGS